MPPEEMEERMEPQEEVEAKSTKDRLGKLLELGETELKRLKRFIKKNLTQWESDTGDLHDRLVDDNDLTENVVEDSGYPYEDAPNYHLPVTAIYMKIFKSMQKRSILGAGDIWHHRLEPSAYGTPAEELAPQIADMMNYKAQNEWNVADKLEEVFHPTNRDGLGLLKVPYVEETETKKDILLFESVDEFTSQFPAAVDAGMDEEEYKAKIKEIEKNAGSGDPVEVEVEFEETVYAGPKAKVVELIDFVTFPANCRDLSSESCKGYGELFTLRRGAVKAKGRQGVWYENAVNLILKRKQGGGKNNQLRDSQDEIEGLNGRDADDYRFVELVLLFDLNREGKERKLLVTYETEGGEIVSAMDYPYRVDFYAPFRIEKRTNRLIGNSIPNQTRELNELMDKQITQRVLSREIATVPTFKAKKSAKTDFDPEAPENRWRPGAIFWLDDPEAFEQFKVQPTDLGESMQEEKNAMGMLDLTLGSPASLFSGQASQADPSAPGNKTAMMINQGNMRMEDPLSTIREGVDKLGEICLSHLYQFGPPQIDFIMSQENGGGVGTINKKYLRRGTKLTMAGVNVADNPDAEMARWMQLGAQLMQLEPTFAQNAVSRTEVWRMALKAGRIANRDKIIPTAEQAKAQQVEMMKEAQKQLAVQTAVQGAVQKKEKETQRYKDIREGLGRRALAEKVVANAAGGNGDAPTNQ